MFFPRYIFKHIIPHNLQASKLPLFLVALWQTSARRALYLLLAPRFADPFQPWIANAKAGPADAAWLEWDGGCADHGIMKEEGVRAHTNQQFSFSRPLGTRGHQMQGAGARMTQTGRGSSWNKRLQPEGLPLEWLREFKVDKESVLRGIH